MRTSLVRLLHSPVARFLAAGLVVLTVLVAATGALSGRAAREEALNDARSSTEVLAHSVAAPAVPRGLVEGRAGAVDRFDRDVLGRLLVGEVQRIKIWTREGTIVYSDETRLIGERFALDEAELAILDEGGTDAEVSDLDDEENRFERGSGGLVEVYTRIRSPEGVPLLFEAYYASSDIERRRDEVTRPFRRITVGALVVVMLVATSMLWASTRRLDRAARERERLLRSAASASDAERRRIARDLHDGVVQDIAGTSFSVAALARGATGPERATLDAAADSLRRSLRSLRSLLVEIHPPGLAVGGLRSALEDLTAPAAAAGVEATVSVSSLGELDDATVALVWRVAQEAVRNTLRHARASRLSVSVARVQDEVVLTVSDDGVGFVPGSARPEAHYGLRGLESLVRDAGGTLAVRSGPGEGTTVTTRVAT